MRPKEIILERNPDIVLDQCPAATPDTDLNDLINIMVNTDERYIRIEEDNDCVGIVTRNGLLRGVQGENGSAD